MAADQKKMNSYQAKRVPLAVLLARLGHEPHHEKRGEIYYFSPFREETDPSFSIKPAENIWYDFGEGKGGGVIDFMLHYYRLGGNVSEALRRLNELGPFTLDAATPPAAVRSGRADGGTLAASREDSVPDDISFAKINPLANTTLLAYLKDMRRIDTVIARRYVQECYFRRRGKDRWYFALAFPNDSGGYELRNADDAHVFKRAWGSKDISTLLPEAGAEQGEAARAVAVFEGFTDFLSALTHYRRPRPALPVIVLNGIGMKDKAVAKIRELGSEKVYLYLDRDAGGVETARTLAEALPGVAVLDKSGLYQGYNDFNAFLQAQRQSEMIR